MAWSTKLSAVLAGWEQDGLFRGVCALRGRGARPLRRPTWCRSKPTRARRRRGRARVSGTTNTAQRFISAAFPHIRVADGRDCDGRGRRGAHRQHPGGTDTLRWPCPRVGIGLHPRRRPRLPAVPRRPPDRGVCTAALTGIAVLRRARRTHSCPGIRHPPTCPNDRTRHVQSVPRSPRRRAGWHWPPRRVTQPVALARST